MLNLLVKSAVRRKILGLFALNKGFRFYPRQAAMEIKESPHAVGLELEYLAKGEILKKSKEGGRTFYQFNSDFSYAPLLEAVLQKMREKGDKEIKEIPDFQRREKLDKNLETVVKEIRQFYNPEKIILFGSLGAGTVGPYSDIDLVVVKKTDQPYFKRVGQLVDLLDYDVDIDFFVYTPEEFEKALAEKAFFKNEILKKGKILYDKKAA